MINKVIKLGRLVGNYAILFSQTKKGLHFWITLTNITAHSDAKLFFYSK